MPTETSATTRRCRRPRHGHDGPHRGTEGAGVLLGEDPALGRAADVADELLADLRRVGVAVADPVQRHHGRRSRRPRRGAPARRRAEIALVGSCVVERLGDGGGVGDRPGHGHRAVGRRSLGRRGGRRTPPATTEATTSTSTTSDLQQQHLPSHRGFHAVACDPQRCPCAARAAIARGRELDEPQRCRASHAATLATPRTSTSTRDHDQHGRNRMSAQPRRPPGHRRHRSGPDPLPLHRGRSSPSSLGIVVGLVAPDFAVRAQAARHRLRRPDQDDDPAGHLLHDRARRRLGAPGRQGRQGRRSGARLLPGDVDGRARHRPGRRQPDQARRRVCDLDDAARQRRPGAGRGRARQHRRLPARHHPDHDAVSALTSGEVLQTLLVALLVGFALQAMGSAGKPILRGIAHLQRLVFRILAMIMWAGADRRVRRDRRRRRRDRRRRAEEPGRAHARLLRHLRALRLRRPRHAARSWSPGSTSSRCSSTWAASSC